MIGTSPIFAYISAHARPARWPHHCRDVEVKFHGSFTDAATVVFRPNVALIVVMDMFPFDSSATMGLMADGEFCITFDIKSK